MRIFHVQNVVYVVRIAFSMLLNDAHAIGAKLFVCCTFIPCELRSTKSITKCVFIYTYIEIVEIETLYWVALAMRFIYSFSFTFWNAIYRAIFGWCSCSIDNKAIYTEREREIQSNCSLCDKWFLWKYAYGNSTAEASIEPHSKKP